jgi:hypothetical protein
MWSGIGPRWRVPFDGLGMNPRMWGAIGGRSYGFVNPRSASILAAMRLRPRSAALLVVALAATGCATIGPPPPNPPPGGGGDVAELFKGEPGTLGW